MEDPAEKGMGRERQNWSGKAGESKKYLRGKLVKRIDLSRPRRSSREKLGYL